MVDEAVVDDDTGGDGIGGASGGCGPGANGGMDDSGAVLRDPEFRSRSSFRPLPVVADEAKQENPTSTCAVFIPWNAGLRGHPEAGGGEGVRPSNTVEIRRRTRRTRGVCSTCRD